MKKKLVAGLLIVSLGINLFLLGDWLFIKQWTEPSSEETIILSEMVQRTIESDDYKSIADKENIIAIDRGMEKAKGGAFPYYFYVSVRTDQETYLFFCNNAECSTMENGAWTYSMYQDEEPRLPFKE